MTDRITKSRREILSIGAGASVLALAGADRSALAQQASAGVDGFARTMPAEAVAPGPLVSGDYELTYTENYASGLRLLGFPEAAILTIVSSERHRLRIRPDGPSLVVTDGQAGGALQLRTPMARDVVGAKVEDWLVYFDRPDRMITSFTAPSKRKAWMVKRFAPAGMINTVIVEGEGAFVATRVWTRAPEQPGIPGVILG
ncbi:MAG: hypothetical protein QM651_10520 [Rhodoblastus sp.]